MADINIYSANGGIVVEAVKFDSLINIEKDFDTWASLQIEIMKIAFSSRVLTVVAESYGSDSNFRFSLNMPKN